MFDLKISIKGDTAILADLRAVIKKMDSVFTDPVPYQTILATNVQMTMMMESDPDGNPWPKLSDSYQEWKDRVAPGELMGYLYGAMKEESNIRGVPVTSGNQMTIAYGPDPVAIQHAIKFTEGGIVTGTNQPPRPFWALSQQAEAEITQHIDVMMQ